MGRILLTLTAISIALYTALAAASWLRERSGRKKTSTDTAQPDPAYFWGFVFALVFYYGFPIWWWRYGLRNSFKLIITCIMLVAAAQAILRYAEMIEVEGLAESLAAGLIISVPIRALAGLWVAKNDRRWRNDILIKRNLARRVGAGDA